MKKFCIFILIFISIKSYAIDTLQLILKEELTREFAEMQKANTPPYFISFRVDDTRSFYTSAHLGNLTSSNYYQRKVFTPEVRIGNYERDNTHEIRSGNGSYNVNNETSSSITLPTENENFAIQQRVWQATDGALKAAEHRYEQVLANVAVKVTEDDKSADLSNVKVETYYEEPLKFSVEKKTWEEKVRRYSKVLSQNKDIITGTATFSYQLIRKYFISSKGANIVQNLLYAKISIGGMVKAENGMELPLQKSYFAFTPDRLPSDEQILKDVEQISSTLTALKNAPEVDPYSGPALLSAAASGVFFHEIFGHRIEGQSMRSESDGQTFKKKVNKQVLPTHLSVSMEPALKQLNRNDLNGYYLYDEQGVKAEKVEIVKDGILKNFLMSRTPIEGFPKSNGHGRAESGKQPVSRQSNLIVHTSNPKTEEELRQMLIDEAKRQGKEYGYYFASVVGGFTNTGRYMPNSFNVTPTEVYRVYVDGRPDELVQGVNLIGTPLSMFAQIDAAGDKQDIFTGRCGAGSGWVPVTAISPILFVRTIEVQKKQKSQTTPPLQDKPTCDN
jgi:predicted Zn-dependent protease